MVQHLPGKISYCIESDGIVIGCGASNDCHSYHQFEGSEFVKHPYPYFSSYFVYSSGDIKTHWWILDTDFKIPSDDRDWRTILEGISSDISPSQGIHKFKATVNGKLSGANGNWERKNPGLGIDDFIKDAIQRFNNPDFRDFINHKDFLAFINKRSEAFFNN